MSIVGITVNILSIIFSLSFVKIKDYERKIETGNQNLYFMTPTNISPPMNSSSPRYHEKKFTFGVHCSKGFEN